MSRHAAPSAAVLLGALLLAGCATASGASGADAEIVLEGNVQVSDSALLLGARRELAAFRDSGRRLADVSDAAYAMERTLRAAGHPDATVEFVAEPAGGPAERVRFRIAEGPVAHLGDVTFAGRTAFASKRLLQYFRFERTGFLRRGPPLFRQSEIEAALADVERTYVLAGYHDVRVGPSRVVWSADRTRADVEVPIDEGRRFTVAAVEVVGELPGIPTERLRDALALKGEPFHRRLAAEAAGHVRRVLLRHGHQHAEVRGRTTVDREAGTGSLRIEVDAGPVVRLRKVVVAGEERTRRAFVRERVPFLPGSVLAQPRLDKALDDLYSTGVFRAVRMRIVPAAEAPEDPSLADLRIEVEELDSRSVELEAGWGSYELLRGGAKFTDRNLAGTGRVLELGTGASLRTASVEGRITDPHLLGPSYSVQLGGGYEQRQEPAFDERSYGADLTVRHTIDRRHYLLGGYSFRAEEAREVDGAVRGAEDEGFVRTAGLFLRFGRDARDDKLYPTRGDVGEVGVFWSAPGLGADLEFIEARASLGVFVPLGQDTVLALGGRFTTRDVLDSRSTLPIQERLFGGGENGVRSFGESELGPFDRSGDPVGGLTAAEAHVEIRQGLIGDLDGALFYDVGTVGRRAWSLDEGTGTAIGVGLRYRLPVGPVRLDLGFNPGERFAADRGWALHFSFGFGF